MSNPAAPSFPFERPDPTLMQYYVYCALLTLIGAPFVIIPLWFRYLTLRYAIDEDGVSMKWGVLFRREVYLTYRRIQDIHVTRNLLERWMGLAKISLQTAAGSSSAELVIEGIKQPEALRDFLYRRMRGARNETVVGGEKSAAAETTSSLGNVGSESRDNVLGVLVDIRDALGELVRRRGPIA
jgi:putative membrane protein